MIKLYDLKDCLDDLDELMDMTYEEWGMFFRSSKQNKIDRIKTSILNDDEFPKVYVLKKDEKLIGSFTIKDKDLDNCDLSPFVVCVLIKKEYRGMGYGKILLDYIREITDNKYSQMYLTTKLDGFYEKIGFEFVDNVNHNGEIEKLYKYKR